MQACSEGQSSLNLDISHTHSFKLLSCALTATFSTMDMKKTGSVFQSHAFSPLVRTFLRFFFLCSHKHYFNHERCDLSSLFFSGTLGAAHTLLFLHLLLFFLPAYPLIHFFFTSYILTHVHITYSFTHLSVVLTSATLWTLKLTNCLPSVFEPQQVSESREDNGKAAVSARYVLHAERGQRSQGLTWLHLVSPFPPPIPDVCVSSALW